MTLKSELSLLRSVWLEIFFQIYFLIWHEEDFECLSSISIHLAHLKTPSSNSWPAKKKGVSPLLRLWGFGSTGSQGLGPSQLSRPCLFRLPQLTPRWVSFIFRRCARSVTSLTQPLHPPPARMTRDVIRRARSTTWLTAVATARSSWTSSRRNWRRVKGEECSLRNSLT